MKKLCKLFWKNDILGKWILYDSDTKLVLEVKKFDQEGKETHVHLLEQGMLEKGVLELDHSIKIWEIELMLAEIPTLPDFHLPEVPNPPVTIPQTPWDQIITTDRTWPLPQWPNITYGGTDTTYTVTNGSAGIGLGSEGISNVEGFSSNLSYVASALMPKNTIALISHPHDKFLFTIGHLGVEKNYKREDEDFKDEMTK